jgi:hypothetical protein
MLALSSEFEVPECEHGELGLRLDRPTIEQLPVTPLDLASARSGTEDRGPVSHHASPPGARPPTGNPATRLPPFPYHPDFGQGKPSLPAPGHGLSDRTGRHPASFLTLAPA